MQRPTHSYASKLAIESLEDRSLLAAGGVKLGLGHPSLEPSTAAVVSPIVSTLSSTQQVSVVGQLATNQHQTISTIPANGDLNPYGVAFVPPQFPTGGKIHSGDILVSNFNNSADGGNLQGRGTTITRIAPNGQTSTFFQGSAGLGLTTALGVLKSGFVIVGNVPTTDGTSATAKRGSLLVLDMNGHRVATLTDSMLLDGPWDLTIHDEGSRAEVFVSNVLNGTVTRLNLVIPAQGNTVVLQSATRIGSGYAHQPDPSALLLGPTGLAFDASTDTLFVASTADNAIYSISNADVRRTSAGKGQLVYQDNVHLHGPLGLVLTPSGDLIVANGDAVNANPNQPSELVEFTRQGTFVSQFSLDSSVDAPFGIAIELVNGVIRFAAVNDNTNSLEIWHLNAEL